MMLWFIVITLLGISGVARSPRVLTSISPHYAIGFLTHSGWIGFGVLGGVFLAVTGAEALYADLGHIGRNPIRALVLGCPASTASKLCRSNGTTAGPPESHGEPFFPACSRLGRLSAGGTGNYRDDYRKPGDHYGAFSITRQAMQLGWFPGFASVDLERRIRTNLCAGGELDDDGIHDRTHSLSAVRFACRCIRHRSLNYHAADDVLLYRVMRDRWQWRAAAAIPVCGIFLTVDLVFFAANPLKIVHWLIPLISRLCFCS